MRINIYIDKITKSIEEVLTLESFETEILPVGQMDLKIILKKHGWKFNWRAESKKGNTQLFKLVIEQETLIQGLVSLQVMQNHVELSLIENAPHNFGSNKKYDGVAGNLFAFACKMSFEFGFEGYVAFKAKTQLIEHYSRTLGASLIYKERMMIRPESAKTCKFVLQELLQ